MTRPDPVRTALKIVRRKRADGGPFNLSAAPEPQLHLPHSELHGGPSHVKLHLGPIHSAVAGRTDHLNMHVPKGAYVIPADVVSGFGEGNTMAGFKVLKTLFDVSSYTKGTPYGAASTGNPYGVSKPRAAGGAIDAGEAVPIIAAGGEFVLSPEQVERIGKGSLDDGHKILDHFVKMGRANIVKTMKSLPGPRKD